MRGEEEKTEREDSRFEPAAIYDRTGNQLRLLNRKTAGSVFHVGGASSVWPSNYKSDDNPLAVSFSVSVSPHAPFYRDKRTLEREKLWRIVRAFKLVHHRVGYASRICLVVAIGQPRISSEMKQLIILTKPPAPWARCSRRKRGLLLLLLLFLLSPISLPFSSCPGFFPSLAHDF